MKALIKRYFWFFLITLLVCLFFINISLGSISIPFFDTLTILTGGNPTKEIWADILLNFRLTKTLTCILSGGALALGGLLMQTLFRNPLAGPDVFGLSSGASLAVAFFVMAGTSLKISFLSSSLSIAFAASSGCIGIFLLVLVIAQKVRDNTSLLIIGLMIGAGAASIVSVLQFMSRAEDQQYYLIWTFGSMGSLNWKEIQILTFSIFIGAGLAFSQIKSLNGWLLGDNYAQSLGINLKKSRLYIIVSTSILAGSVTAFCGPIAFIGLAVPHLTRMLVNTTNHKVLIPAVMIYGAVLMLFCDSASRIPGNAFVIPINAITALIGAPIVVWIIIRGRKILV